MKIIVLGAGAGGGFPQWNCNCGNCRRARAGDPSAVSLTQSSLAVSADGERWVLLNASPDLRRQIELTPALQPQTAGRSSPIVGAVLCNADVDHTAGLLTMREMQPLAVYATPRVLDVLARNAMFNVLNAKLVERRPLTVDHPSELLDRYGQSTGLRVEAFTVPGKVALWLEQIDAENFGSVPEDTVGLKISDLAGTKSFFYIPGCASMPPELAARLTGAGLVMFDGTTYADNEMIVAGFSDKTASRMGHMSMAGTNGSLNALGPLGIGRRVYVHINNTNPTLLGDTLERRVVEAAGWEVGFDGMEILL
ncbi:MAG TPA: pyrroloquinoline quinone biosynthesis protein PqqB [Patescibacteria group bacterium]|nr:pyrroloquinoline quinone biosynthesis protein PqqB [Patescibacteria group bacterium]